ncbi:3-oxoacyl-[acyl-carrier-protein] synthase 3 [Alphaproteobacteria bacterium]|nr:3-oxoacyl-[acyl-carrier-protein] synthase 3 [Alphaproteobacteria bacterium]GHS96241.1 3-oxoacyl-[acyl-carrier-protein] synthase 3 [Alphaproteobacteria bacterium]
MSVGSFLAGTGWAAPSRSVSNEDLSRTLDTSDAWIRERTGIQARRVASHETVASLSVQASQQALARAHIQADHVDAIILATTSPDHSLPATATHIQQELGASRAFAFDLQAVCSGFLFALSVADHFIRAQTCQTVLVIGADIMSRLVDWTDRSTCVLFGDAAGATLLTATEGPSRVLSTHLFSDGAGYDALYADALVPTSAGRGAIKMNGRSVYITAIEKMEASLRSALEQNHATVADIDWFVPHQANKRIMDVVAKRLDLPEEKIIVTIDSFANTSAATIPLSLALAEQDGRIQKGDLVALSAMGAGFTWGASLVRW